MPPILLCSFFALITAFKASEGGFSISPTSKVVYLGSEATFECQHLENNDVYWRVNGTSLNMYHPPRITTRAEERNGENVRILSIEAISKYNGTVVDCVAVSLNESEETSLQASMVIQGLLNAVGNLKYFIINGYTVVNWTAPFTLNVTDTIPDFTYSIKVKRSFDGGKIVSVHDHTADGYIVRPGESSPCGRFDITVTPVNGAGNGTSVTIVGYLFTSDDTCVVRNCMDLEIATGVFVTLSLLLLFAFAVVTIMICWKCCRQRDLILTLEQSDGEADAVKIRSATGDEFNSVLQLFKTTWAKKKGSCPSDISIFVVTNHCLSANYDAYKSRLQVDLQVEERHFHGTKLTCNIGKSKKFCKDKSCGICNISKIGLDRQCIQTNIWFQRFGQGFYLAPNSSKSHDYTEGAYGCRAMLLCDVCPGNKYPLKNTDQKLTGPPEGFDSIYGEVGRDLNYPEIVVHSPDAVLPQYIIVYRKNGTHRICINQSESQICKWAQVGSATVTIPFMVVMICWLLI